MDELIIGGFAISTAGHDTGEYYIIFQMDCEYVYLVDGKIRTIDRPKKKKKIHVTTISELDTALADKVKARLVKDEEVKRSIKLLKRRLPNVKDRCC